MGGTESIQHNQCNQHIILDMKIEVFRLMLCYLSNYFVMTRKGLTAEMCCFLEEAVSGDTMNLGKGSDVLRRPYNF